MRLIILISMIFFLTTSEKCTKKEPGVYKGKLEIKAICMNYTISVIEGDIDTSLVATSWTDENTGKTYKNAFELASKCNFPKSINAGDEFFFTIDTADTTRCAICMAYYPVPPKKLMIKVLEDKK
jgi:hypothetical protein